ncbi:MAG: hypothetical protein GXX10_06875 [Clostridiaceae bacterium]|nr:hypothetical protein [Clostridiaceae bacterium]
MKLTSFAIIFVIIIFPFLFISGQQSHIVMEDAKLRSYYDNLIDNAVQDAAFILSQKGTNLSYSDNSNITSTKELAAQTFFDCLYHSFNAYGNQASMAKIEACVPVLIFLERDGFYLYALNSYKGLEGYTEVKHSWFPFMHYIGENLHERYSVRYTLGNYVFVYDHVDKAMYEGEYESFKDRIEFFSDPQMFENLRLSAIQRSVLGELKNYIEEYNRWEKGRSLSVQIELPAIDDADWARALTDEGILVFAQGFPVLAGDNYKHYSLGGGRVIRKEPLIGYTYKGQLYYGKTQCSFYLNEVINDPTYDPDNYIYFSNPYEAAKNGYFPCTYCRP